MLVSFRCCKIQLLLYGGFGHEFDMGLGVDIGLINYRYPGAKLNWFEYYAGLSYTVWGVGLSGSVNYTDDVFNSNEDAIFYTAAAEYTFDTKFPITISGDVGYYDLDDFADEIFLANTNHVVHSGTKHVFCNNYGARYFDYSTFI